MQKQTKQFTRHEQAYTAHYEGGRLVQLINGLARCTKASPDRSPRFHRFCEFAG